MKVKNTQLKSRTLHIRTPDSHVDKCLHISHIYEYISAYVISKKQVSDLVDDINNAIKRAKREQERVIVDHEGEMFLVVNPNSTFSLCLEWKHFEFDEMETTS